MAMGSCAEDITKQENLIKDISVICYATLRPLVSLENLKNA